MLKKIFGVLSLLLSGLWWLGLLGQGVEHFLWDRVLRLLDPYFDVVTIGDIFRYGPPAVLAVVGFWLLTRPRTEKKKPGDSGRFGHATVKQIPHVEPLEFAESYPDIRVADAPTVIELFEGKERDKLIPLLEAEKITAWGRLGFGDPPLLKMPGNIWRSNHLVFLPMTAGQTKNQTFIRKNGRIESTYFDVHLNKAQIKKIWPTIDDAVESLSPATHDTPIWRAVTHVRAAINDREQDKCFPATRQAALDKKIKIRGCREIDTGPGISFSDVRSDIAPEYWKVSTIGALATDEKCQGDVHTNPETAFAWGPKGIYEKHYYADLRVDMKEIKKLWPHEP
jgi:hypothetical protein